MLKRAKGIVLRSTVFGEADLIVTYLTPEYGLLKAFAKSPRKVKSRFGSSLEPLTYARISFLGKEESTLPRLTQSDIIRPFHALREDFRTFLSLSELLELNLSFLAERDPHPDIFTLLLTTLSKFEVNGGSALLYLYYKIKFLEMAGYSPKLDVCGACGKALPQDDSPAAARRYAFCLPHGAVVCPRCEGRQDNASLKLSGGALRFYRSLLQWNSGVVDRINAPESLLSEVGGVIDSHIRYALGPSRVSSRKYLDGIPS
ncbi:MAG: DNA repair protein RecO [Thermodesulfovibrionales bacterium]